MSTYPFVPVTGFTNPMTTEGDLIYEDAVPEPDRLPVGTSGQVLTVSDGLPSWQNAESGFANPMTTLGDIIYENSTPAPARLAGSTSATKQFLTQTGTGLASGAPAWGEIASGDVPTLNQNTTGNAATATNLAGGATLPDYLAPAVVTLAEAGSGTITINAAEGNDFRQELSGSSATFGAPSNPVDGQRITIQIAQDSTGSRTVSWATGSTGDFDFGTAGAPTLSTGASDVDILGFIYNASKARWCYVGSALGF